MVSKVLEQDIANAVTVLQKGGVVVFPTETAYGLAADATNHAAVNRVFSIKGRLEEKALPLIAADRRMVESIAIIPPALSGLVEKYWPGPLTLILPVMGDRLAQGVVQDGKIAIRVSSHPVAIALSRALGSPIVSTSANRSGEPLCYSVDAVHTQFDGCAFQPDLYLDAGELANKSPSTIVGIGVDGYPVVLRQGSVKNMVTSSPKW